jgi:streptogramin lyase
MDPTSLGPTTYEIGQGLSGIVTAPDAVWVVETLDGTVSSIDPSSGTIRSRVAIGDGSMGIELGGGYIWVSRPA